MTKLIKSHNFGSEGEKFTLKFCRIVTTVILVYNTSMIFLPHAYSFSISIKHMEATE